MAHFITRSSVCLVTALSASFADASILVDEGFKTGTAAGCYSTTDKTSLANGTGVDYTESIGFATNRWEGTTGVIVSRTGGLSFPAAFAGNIDPAGAGAMGFRGESGVTPNWSNGKTTQAQQADWYRNQRRKLVGLNGAAGEKRYFRALMTVSSDAMSQLNTADTWLSWRNGYTVGLATPASSMSNTSSVMDCPRYMHFSFYKNGTGTPQMSFVVKGSEGTAKRIQLGSVTAGHTYLCVAEITLGDGPDQFRAFYYDCANTTPLDPENLPWVVNNQADFTLVDDQADLALFVGGNYYTMGTFTVDEIRVATTLGEVIPLAGEYVSVGAMPVANLAMTAADLSAAIDMKGVASVTPKVAYGTAADALTQTVTLAPVSEAGTVTTSLTDLAPITTYYYQWTAEADGVDPATSSVQSFRTKGEVVLGEVTTGGTPATGGVWASVDVSETGIGTTTVTCYAGETAETMTAIGTWENVQAGDTLVATNTASAWGKTCVFKFTSSFEYGGATYTAETTPVSKRVVALDFLAMNASGDWMDAANWSLQTPPSELLSACISNVTTTAPLFLQDADAVVKSLSIKAGKAAVDLRGTSTMTIGDITFGDVNIQNCDGGLFSTTGGVVTVNGSVGPYSKARTSNNLLDLNGTVMTINGSLSTASLNDSGSNTRVNVNAGSVLTITNGLTVSYSGTVTVDAATVTNRKNLVVANNAKEGTLVLKNGAFFRQPGANVCGVGGKGTGTLRVLTGSTFDASGAAFYLGSDGDQSWNSGSMLVSNATFKAASFVSPKHTGFQGTYTIDIDGPEAVFRTTGDVTLGAVAKQGSALRTSGSTRMNVKGGTVTVGGTLNVGGGENDRAMNYLTVSGESAAIEASAINCCTNATVRFVIPATGFAHEPVVNVTNTLSLAATMPAIRIDATACTANKWMTLLRAGTKITNLTAANLADRVTVTGTYKDNPYGLRLVADASGETTALQFRVKSGGMMIIVR